ncbi:Type 1 glutamine amidotransferase-like domain-containing protein [Chitinimonas sp.]|uniref:Type 1 glutamine amidotransferase-like domain-containing protein n=1 Tax=Chitinimonas sp. TaxID=1934313 RepID=UPI002F91F267
MSTVCLIGGGWTPAAWPLTLGPFVMAAHRAGATRIAVVLHGEPGDPRGEMEVRFAHAFEAAGLAASQLRFVWVGDKTPLTFEILEEIKATAVFVGGGLTPAYHAALCQDMGWLDEIRQLGLAYGGFSAGAAIAANHAILGGWQVLRHGKPVPMVHPDMGEDLDLLTVLPGLGLVPFAVDVHAGQWGTVSRLMQAVDTGAVGEGWAIDEDTALIVEQGHVRVVGLGHAYHVAAGSGGALKVTLHPAVQGVLH